MSHLADTLAESLRAVDVAHEPRRLAEGATLLDEVQQHDAKHARLAARVEAFLAREPGPAVRRDGRTLADRASEVLSDHPDPMHYREIADEIRGRGFRHAREPKHGDAQLADSVWSAMYDDPQKRFAKVGRGVWDLSSRVPPSAG